MRRTIPWLIVLAAAGLVAAQPTVLNPDPNGPQPIDAADTLFIEDMM